MVFVYGECRHIVRDAVRLYAKRFPERVTPSRSAFTNGVAFIFHGDGSVGEAKGKRGMGGGRATDDRNTVNILAAVTQNPHVSTRKRERKKENIIQRSVSRILHLKKFHAFDVSLHQELHGNDFQNRVNFCEWGLQTLQNDELFLTKVLFTDEATFTNYGQVNRHNMHYWSIENPWWLREVDKQRPWSVNDWCGLLNGEIIGPYFINDTLSTSRYKHILTEISPHLLENIPLRIRQTMWFQQDGCPAHSARITQLLNSSM
ncbi:hypothetical protein WN55_02392 [Dufourea novaeangliae]|uniref:DUF4817 domain-containing protein n=1 Tax=Dufourea novaeangliae TaxID=178035 RepID=A0A154PFU8_DUFNO|nr:hypothetical protein WN55_02392 [Dufourea novaeangliae]